MNRTYSPYLVSTWTKFKSPLETETQVNDLIAELNLGENHDLKLILLRLSKNLKALYIEAFIEKHTLVKNETSEVPKTSLASLFRFFQLFQET